MATAQHMTNCVPARKRPRRQCLFSMTNHTNLVTCVRWGGEGLIYSGSRDCGITAWDAADGKLVRTLKGHAHWVNTLALSSEHVLRTGAFDRGGSAPAEPAAAQAAAAARYAEATGGRPERLVSGSDDFTLFLWQPSASKQPLQRLTGHQQLINQVAFSPDGRWLLSASFDKSIKLWDGLKGTFLATMRAHVGPVYQVRPALSPSPPLPLLPLPLSLCLSGRAPRGSLPLPVRSHLPAPRACCRWSRPLYCFSFAHARAELLPLALPLPPATLPPLLLYRRLSSHSHYINTYAAHATFPTALRPPRSPGRPTPACLSAAARTAP